MSDPSMQKHYVTGLLIPESTGTKDAIHQARKMTLGKQDNPNVHDHNDKDLRPQVKKCDSWSFQTKYVSITTLYATPYHNNINKK